MLRPLIIASVFAVGLQGSAHGLLEKHGSLLTEPPTYICYHAEKPIKIDGKLNEESWKRAGVISSFVDIRGNEHDAPNIGTEVRMLWDDEYIYIGAVLEETNIMANLKERDAMVYRDNAFEVFVDPDGDGRDYFEFEVNALGTLFDLVMDRAYRSNAKYLASYDCDGLQLKVSAQGTINKADDTDKSWTVEMAIPAKSITVGHVNPLKAGNIWRMNFLRVQWPTDGSNADNWAWAPSGRVDAHMPERWGFVEFVSAASGTAADECKPPYDMQIYNLLWAMFYEQKEHYAQKRNYLRDVKSFWMCDHDLAVLPKDARISVDASANAFAISITDKAAGKVYNVNQDGEFRIANAQPRVISNYVWVSPHRFRDDSDWKEWFGTLRENGITGVMFEGYDENVYKMCHEGGLQAHHWKWTMNRSEVLASHPEWFAVNRKGESCYDKPAYVDYYRFLCPNHEGVAEYLAQDYVQEMSKPYVDGVHLDYVRMPDVVLPTSLWGKYGIEQTTELPEYDYCYCEVCREKYKAQTGVDPLDLKYPMNTPSWLNFRLNSITAVVDSITQAVKSNGGYISAAVFPGPSMARSMVRQDWGNWSLDAYYPMVYNGFYGEGIEWIGESTRESVKAVGGRADIYTGVMFNDIKDRFIPAVKQVLDNGASGISFFQAPDEEHLKELKAYLDSEGYIVK